MIRPLRLVPDGTTIQFMRGRFAGLIGSAILSTLSVVLFFYPGLNLGVDFRGGVVVEPDAALGQVLDPDDAGSRARRLPDSLSQDRSAVPGEAGQASRAAGHRQQQRQCSP